MNHFIKSVWLIALLTLPLAGFASSGASTSAPSSGGHGGGEASKKPLPPPQPDGPDNINTYLHLQVNNLTRAEAPRIVDRKLILTWKGDVNPRYVAAAFQHESWKEKHLFWKNQNGVFFLVYDLAADSPSTLQYRLIVDGLWQTDPSNPSLGRNDQGIALSRMTVPREALPLHHGPVQGYFGEVEFTYHGKPGVQVSIAGNFNQWDPFAHFLEEHAPGEYEIKLSLPPGMILYRLVVGSRSILDPSNIHSGHDDQGGTFSYFENKLVQPAKVLESTVASAATHH